MIPSHSAIGRSYCLRGGAIYNTSRYIDLATGRMQRNWGVYAAADRKLTQPDSYSPAKGHYVGASFNYAPLDLNLYTEYYQIRAYAAGLVNLRRTDLASFVLSYKKLSSPGLEQRFPLCSARDHVISASGSY